jgi:hypothetical protein
VAGLSDFNLFLFEANERNRMKEAQDLFDEICNDSCYDAGIKFFLVKFLARNHSSAAHQVYYHVTCATDTRNIQIVFNAF